jgi:hypothetical protein
MAKVIRANSKHFDDAMTNIDRTILKQKNKRP